MEHEEQFDPIAWLDLGAGRAVWRQIYDEPVKDFLTNPDDYDLVAMVCDAIGFMREDVGAVAARYDADTDRLTLRVALMDGWVPEYLIPLQEFSDGKMTLIRRQTNIHWL